MALCYILYYTHQGNLLTIFQTAKKQRWNCCPVSKTQALEITCDISISVEHLFASFASVTDSL
jgi:hypothetical protein